MGDDLIDREAAIAVANAETWEYPQDDADAGNNYAVSRIVEGLRALPSATQAGGWMPPDGSVMVPIPIRLAREFRDHVADEMAAWPDDTAYQDDLRAFASALDAAPLPPAPEGEG